MAKNEEKVWKQFLEKHFSMLVIWIVAATLTFIGALRVFLWFVDDAQATNLVPMTLDLWAMNHFISFILHLIFWELIFIGIPVLIFIAANYFLWWKRLPDTEKKAYKQGHLFGGRSKRSDAEGGISFLIFIAFIIKIYFDGNWGVPFATWEFDYLVYSWVWSMIWVLIIIGIPMLIGGVWYIHHIMKK